VLEVVAGLVDVLSGVVVVFVVFVVLVVLEVAGLVLGGGVLQLNLTL
jgi:hypothetical protein